MNDLSSTNAKTENAQQFSDYSSDPELLAALQHLKQQVKADYTEDVTLLSADLAQFQADSGGPWWEVKEFQFTSTVPFIGRWIARFRTMWNNVSTTWFVRAVIHQQNWVNHNLVKRQDRIAEIHQKILSDLDRNQVRLIRQLAELQYRLDQLEKRLDRLEQES